MKAFVFAWILGVVNCQYRPHKFAFNQRFPNDKETNVCGKIRDVIPRNSGRFRKILIRNTNNDAHYDNDDCRRMTARAKSKLDILASRTIAEWSRRVHVRVLRAWTDRVEQSDRASLHYEGRSVRLQTSDRDRGKLGRLAGIALESGFDYVEYKNYDYIRASVIPDVCQASVDLVFLLDGSGSVGARNFEKVKRFVKKVIDFFNIGRTGTHIAVVQFSTNTRTEFPLTRYFSKSEMKTAVDRIVYQDDLTFTGEALTFLKRNIFTSKAGMRTDAGIPKVLVLLTDGHSNGKAVGPPAEELKRIGINIFSIGVGHFVSIQELNAIASDPDSEYVFQRTFDNLIASWVDRLSAVSCSEGSLIDACRTSATSVESGSFKYFRTQFKFVSGNEVSVELRDITGISHLYASRTSKNPGPLDQDSVKNEQNSSPKAVSVTVGSSKTVFVAVQGQRDKNTFSLSFWDNLFARNKYTATVRENVLRRPVITLGMASGNSDEFRYSITGGNIGGAFGIYSNVPKIYMTKRLDRETVEKYNLVITAESRRNKCRKSRTNVLVTVLDENDNSPKFTENPYRVSVLENTGVNTLIKTVTATDADSGANARITYRITGAYPSHIFTINSQGQIRLTQALDYERERFYRVNLEASDRGSPRKTATSRLDVTVMNVNEAPSLRCNNADCKYNVDENVPRGTKFGAKLIGADPDTGTNCKLQYIMQSSVKKQFAVSESGEISTNGPLNREYKNQYGFTVTVRDCGGLTASVYIVVRIADVNDNAPQFPGLYTVDILESEQPGSNVLQVRASDADEGNNARIVYSISGSDSSAFRIDSSSGRITTKTKLDYETKTSYRFTVTATDKGGSPKQGTTTVAVNILDINDNAPVFRGSYRASVSEDASRGVRVVKVHAKDRDSGSRGEVRYSIVGGNFGNAFAVNGISGQITVNSDLDRETRSSYNLVVQASDRGSPSLNARTTVLLTIDDVNDNSPVFQGLPYSRSIPEDYSSSNVILQVRATDKDEGRFGRLTYFIKSPLIAQQTFKIDARDGRILLKKALDYELKKDYTFTIAARDGGGRESTATVKVIVEDVNDNEPLFQNNSYTGSVAENVNIGHVIGAVKATDADSGPRGRISYSITAGNHGNAFLINTAGSLSVASSLDRETVDSYTLTIRATDSGSPAKSSVTSFTVIVTDINDNKPTFDEDSYSFAVAENNAQNAVVGRIGFANDKDIGKNAEIVYSVVGRNNVVFAYHNGQLIAKQTLDREHRDLYTLVVEARDKGTPSLYSRVPVVVTVEDLNDNKPVFAQNSYSCKIDENSASSSRVCFARATDADIGNNGKVVYELVHSSSEFSVSQDSGEIKTKVLLDRETADEYRLSVRAKDLGDPRSLSSTVDVTVRVVDKNDNEPEFTKISYSFEVKENAKVGDRVDVITASDNDVGLNGNVVYSITGGNIRSAFTIDQNSGVVSVGSALDRETLASYRLTIRASDQGNPVLSSSKLVPIKVLDVNDNAPKFTQQKYSGRVAEDASIGSRIVQVKATDMDEGVNADIKYSITAGEFRGNFTIHEDTGLITTALTLDFETKESYQLTVTATDQGTPSRSSSSVVNIQVTNTNDNAPTFLPTSPIVRVSEAVAIGTEVVKFNATDKDGNRLSFSITDGNVNNAFEVNADTGLLFTRKQLDRETIPRFNLTVTVTELNHGNAGKSSSQNLTVIVTDENDNAPVIDNINPITVDENVSPGILLIVRATDNDVGKNADISYSIDSSSTAKFDIHSQTGELSTKVQLDHEDKDRYVVTVTARDSGTPSLSSSARVKIIVNDLNDNKPRFKNDYSTILPENTAQGRTVLRVEASDPDSGANGKISYSITSGNELGYFNLDPKEGIITVAKSPDREVNPSFTLNVHASNNVVFASGTPTAKTDSIVSIIIADVNDNIPVITNTKTSFKISEGSSLRTEVLDVNASDQDVGVNGAIEYDIVKGNVKNVFKINRDTGVISTRGSLDRETVNRYTLTVQASDKGSPRLFSTKDFSVVVTDIDDNAPVFYPNAYEESVPEDANVGTSVVQVSATDKDIGVNAKITFSIESGNDENHFEINSTSGEIKTKALLDFETIQSYNLLVKAKDTRHSSQASVVVRVLNINDNSPVFEPASYRISVPEDHGLDKSVVTVSATDADPFGGLTYTIDPADDMFSIDPASGQISPAAELDREVRAYYNLTVRVTDGVSPALSDMAFVEITITDTNDNSPMFNSSLEHVSVRENAPQGKVLLTVSATDADTGVNAELRYRITDGNEADTFSIDEVSGKLRVNANIDREKMDKFRLQVVARDQGSPTRESAPLVVSVTVLDENDNTPRFTNDIYEQNITENLSAGTLVKEMEAFDKDINENGWVSYAIVDGDTDGYFTVDNSTGIVQTTRAIDREHIPSFTLTVDARDHGTPPRNSTVILQVNVIDANDNPPSLADIVANVTEEKPAGEFVTRVVAVDPDLGPNGRVEYSLTQQGEQSLRIDAKTGVIKTRVKMDYEEQTQHTFKIIATDKGNPPLSTTADLVINVLDVDDNCPVFSHKEYNVTIKENLPFLTEIVTVHATDVDTVGGIVDYGIRSGNTAGTFRIDRINGTIEAGSNVDREIAAEYNLIVRAGNDYCGVDLTGIDLDESIEVKLSKSTARVNIFVTDVNDNAPVFLQDSYKYELTDVNTESLLWVNATDPDEGISAQFDFALAGVTRVRSKRILVVTAKDKGTPAMTSNTTIDVTGTRCEAMSFSVSPRGHVTVKTLCSFDEVLVPKNAFVGESAIFNCSAQGNTVPEYRWYRNSVPITDWLKKGEYKIKQLTKNDDGVYSCIASSEAGNILSDNHRFFVKEPAKVIAHPKDIWVEVDRKANLSCRATGDKPVQYRWFKGNEIILTSEDVTADLPDLVFNKAIPQDAQVYHCEVSNYPDAKADKSRSARLEVYSSDAVAEIAMTVDKPLRKESCQYFNVSNVEETVESLIDARIAVVEFTKPATICNLTACSSDPCLNHGRCQAKGSDFVCLCPREWTGKQCQIDVDECQTETCNNGTCVNTDGSFYCECPKTSSGKLCQFTEDQCDPNPCPQGTCYPKEVKEGHECLGDVRSVAMVFKLDKTRMPFKDWMLYDVAKEIENAINDAANVQTRDGTRGRRDTTVVDYSGCSVRIKRAHVQDSKLDLQIILVCSQPPDQKYICDAMIGQNKVTSCTDENGTRESTSATNPTIIAPAQVALAFIARRSSGKNMEASKIIDVLKEGNIENELSKYSMNDVVLRARSANREKPGESESGISSGAITGVAVGVIVLIIVVIFTAVFVNRTRQRGDKEMSIGGRAVLSRTQSADAIVQRGIDLRELDVADTRGVNNKTFSEIYEERHPSDPEDVTFMIENPQKALRKQDVEYLKELESSPWFHGSMSRANAEEMLNSTGTQGTFLVRAGLDIGEFYISVKTPSAQHEIQHISVNRRDKNFTVLINSEPRNFPTFSELVEYLRANPTHIEGVSNDVILADHIAKVQE